MPFSTALKGHPAIKRVLLARRRPVVAYGLAVGLVALATLLRLAVSGYAIEGVPFITYYPAIILATLAGGLWAGLVATVLSAAVAWYLFMPPAGAWDLDQRGLVSLLLFIVIAGINVAIVALLNAAIERIFAQEENSRVLIESAPSGIVVVDQEGTITLANPAAESLFGYTRGELVGQSVDVLVPPQNLEAHRTARKAFLRQPTGRTFRDLSGRRKDGSEFPVDIGLSPIGRSEGTSVLATIIDISDRKRVEENQQLIIRELEHRTRNLFAVFQAVARHTLDDGRPLADAKDALIGRVRALAGAYNTLTETASEGATLADVLRRQLAGFSKRVTVTGCDLVVNHAVAQQFALIVHELATNAVKYGAFSTPDGRVSIEGKVDRVDGRGVVSFRWMETGGPPATPPTRKGFGSVILLDSAKHFAQDVTMDFGPPGMVYELTLQLSTFEDPKPRFYEGTV
jgi:PAS domain S-box-containing protein